MDEITNTGTHRFQTKSDVQSTKSQTDNFSDSYDVSYTVSKEKSDVIACTHVYRKDNSRNLPGLNSPHVKNMQVAVISDSHLEPPDPKKPKLSPLQAIPGLTDPCSSPEFGKRRRIQHDYRRLSSSGYLDDYETSRERRFSNESDNTSSPSPTKSKPTGSPGKSKVPDSPTIPPLKLTLKIPKPELVNGNSQGLLLLFF